MSHFVRIRTELRERSHLLAALAELGHAVREGPGQKLLGDGRDEECADIVVATGCDHEIGLRRKGERYELVADWYHIERLTELRRGAFLEQLTQRYAYSVVREQARAQNLIVEEERQENGDIILLLSERG